MKRSYFKIGHRKVSTKRGKGTYILSSLTVPEDIASKFDDGVLFGCELTEGGILFFPVEIKRNQTIIERVKTQEK